ncbi:MAG: hypothetical protein RLY43_161 [Bacteroidota bacterium]|jgi:cytochrome b involved in lipid metabolism
MKTKTLLFGVGGIFLVTLIAYLIISPIASKKIEEEFAEEIEEPGESVELIATTTTEEKVVETKTSTTVKPTTSAPTAVTPKPTTTDTPVVQEEVKKGYTSSDVAMHSTESSCWSIINGSVYDLTAYIPRHPGGSSKIIRICGKDGSSAFEDQHGGESRPESILQKYWIGNLI